MNEFPEGWFRGTPDTRAAGGAASGEPTTQIPAGGDGGPAGSNWPAQPPSSSAGRAARGYDPSPYSGGRGGPGGPGYLGTGRARRWLRPRRIFAILAVVVALLLVGGVVEYFSLNGKLHRQNVLVDYSGRPVQGSGTNWLIAGSDSRQGLSRKELRKLSAGTSIGRELAQFLPAQPLPAVRAGDQPVGPAALHGPAGVVDEDVLPVQLAVEAEVLHHAAHQQQGNDDREDGEDAARPQPPAGAAGAQIARTAGAAAASGVGAGVVTARGAPSRAGRRLRRPVRARGPAIATGRDLRGRLTGRRPACRTGVWRPPEPPLRKLVHGCCPVDAAAVIIVSTFMTDIWPNRPR